MLLNSKKYTCCCCCCYHRAYASEWQRAADVCDAKAAKIQEGVRLRHDASARPLSGLRVGCHVDMQDTDTSRWDRRGVIVGVGRRRTYLVKLPNGRIYWRNRRFLRPHRPLLASDVEPPAAVSVTQAPPVSCETAAPAPTTQPPPVSCETAAPASALRRSSRQRRQPQRLTVRWDAATYV